MEKYCCDLRQHIEKNYIPITHNNTGTVEFRIVMDRAGDILLLKQISSSGDETLNNHAKKIIEKSFPFEEFPKEEMIRSYFDIIIPIKFIKQKE